MMTLHGAFHPKSDVDRLYVGRDKGGRGLISCEKCVKSKENNFGWYIKNTDEMPRTSETQILTLFYLNATVL